VLFRAGESGDGCYRIEDGLLKLTMVSNSGSERILAFVGRNAVIGELSIIDGLPRSMSAVAVRDATLSFLNRAAFEAFAEKHPELCRSLLRLLAKRVRQRDKLVAATSFLSLKGRIAQTLLELADHFGQEVGPERIVIRQKIRQTDLAAMAGIARENVTRILNEWERRKLVSRLSGYYSLRISRYSSIKLTIRGLHLRFMSGATGRPSFGATGTTGVHAGWRAGPRN
jgi:CRP-like cAMP-binding protein